MEPVRTAYLAPEVGGAAAAQEHDHLIGDREFLPLVVVERRCARASAQWSAGPGDPHQGDDGLTRPLELGADPGAATFRHDAGPSP